MTHYSSRQGHARVSVPSDPVSRRLVKSSPLPIRMRVSERRVLLIVGDVVANVAAVLIALSFWARVANVTFNSSFVMLHAAWVVVLPLLWFVLANANDYYNLGIAAKFTKSANRLLRIVIELLGFYLAIFFFAPPGHLPRLFIVYYAVSSLIMIGLWRSARIFLIGWTGMRRRAVILGGGEAADIMWDALKDEASGDYDPLGYVASTQDTDLPQGSLPKVSTPELLPQVAMERGVSEIIIAYSNEIPGDAFQAIMSCYELGISIVAMPVLYEQITGRVPIEHVGSHLWPLVLPLEKRTITFQLYLFVRRLIDIVFSLVGVIAFIPIFAVVAPTIKLTSKGPIFYRQERLGRGGRRFTIIKLRTMRDNAEKNGAQWAETNDPRITSVGRFLRKSRLDEVPQLLNVLMGDMALVGPRPERPEFVEKLVGEIPFYRTRLAVLPGLTGWAQVRYRYGNSPEDALRKLQYDLYYIRHQSTFLDVEIMIRTVRTILLFRGT